MNQRQQFELHAQAVAEHEAAVRSATSTARAARGPRAADPAADDIAATIAAEGRPSFLARCRATAKKAREHQKRIQQARGQ